MGDPGQSAFLPTYERGLLMDCLLMGCLSPLSLARIMSTGWLGSHATPEHAQKPARPRRLLLTWLLSGAWLLTGLAGSVAASETVEYNRDIRPILAEHCFACHGADAEARQADLRLDQREALIDSGVITPGDPADSALIDRVFTDDPELMMPPAETKKPLSLEQRELLSSWVEDGAEYQSHWAFLPPRKRNPPTVQNEAWVKNDIDRFILAKLEQSGLTPAPEADAHSLPPHPPGHHRLTTRSRRAERLLRDYPAGGDEALSVWVDRLMNSPAWGEHRALLARRGSLCGYARYALRQLSRDVALSRLGHPRLQCQSSVRSIHGRSIGRRFAPQSNRRPVNCDRISTLQYHHERRGTIEAENLANYAVDRVQTFGWVYLGLTTNCAQCHDHKFDPISQKDFYSLAAFFRNTTQKGLDGNVKDGRSAVLLVPSMEDQPRWQSAPRRNRSGNCRA
ncbi:MAG: DUF1549 domain-containing protein [Pirellulaceae bacterium]